MKSGPFQPLRLVTTSLLALVVIAVGVAAGLTWQESQRLELVSEHLSRMHDFEVQHLKLERTLTAGLSDRWLDVPAHRDGLTRQLDALITMRAAFHPETPEHLHELRGQLEQLGSGDLRAHILESLQLLGEIAEDESQAYSGVVQGMKNSAERQLRIEVAAVLGILAFSALSILLLRRQILRPLDALGALLTQLARRDYSPTPAQDLSPRVRPVYESFNHLAQRLAELDEAQEKHAQSLEQQVRNATQALLEQQRSLARSERLSATGELAVSIAHELRNPLAGIQMTLSNLRDDLDSPALVERIDLVIAEVMRLSRLLGELLDTSHPAPEVPRRLDLRKLVEDMLALLRYQLAPNIVLENRIDAELEARLPEGRLRQALLNLVLNAARAMEDSGGHIAVEASRDAKRVSIAVCDDGPGFPETLLRDGVQRFRSSRRHGTGGLGLAMVQRFTRDEGGQMQLENCDPRGARVTLLLPSRDEDA